MENYQAQRGFTLIEILVSLVMIALFIGPLMGFFLQSQKGNVMAEERIQATYLAQKYMEDMYHISQTYGDYHAGLEELKSRGFSSTPDLIESIETVYRFTKDEPAQGYRVDIETDYSSGLARVLVKIVNIPGNGQVEAQMETILIWKNE